MKPNLFSVRINDKNNPGDWEEYICDGKSIYEYNGVAKTITEYKLGSSVLTPLDDSPIMALLGGLTAVEIKKRFVVSLVKEDEYYVYLAIKPTLPKDKQEFEETVLALFGPKVAVPGIPYLPAMIQVKKPNGDMETWMLARQVINPKVEEATFRPRDEPGFTRRQLQQGTAPAAPPAPRK
jgi:TIGR03009 family protein